MEKEVKAKVEKEVKAKVITLESFEDYKTFKSNGKSKHMPKDVEYQVNFEMASIFLSKNYGELID